MEGQMARSWTTRAFEAGDQFKADQFSGEANAIAQQINGNLDQNGMPLKSVTNAMMADPVVVTNAFGDNTKSTYLPTQSYHASTYQPAVTAVTADQLGSVGDYRTNWETDSWDPFWTSFPAINSTNTFNSKEGMLYGNVTISPERRPGRLYISGDGAAATVTIGRSATYKIGIFVNGVLVADTGSQTIGQYTIDLPYSCAIGTEHCVVEVKWQADQDLYLGLTSLATTVTLDFFKYFLCSGMHLYTRNQYR